MQSFSWMLYLPAWIQYSTVEHFNAVRKYFKKLTVGSFSRCENSVLLYRSADDTKQGGLSTVQKCQRLCQRRDKDV